MARLPFPSYEHQLTGITIYNNGVFRPNCEIYVPFVWKNQEYKLVFTYDDCQINPSVVLNASKNNQLFVTVSRYTAYDLGGDEFIKHLSPDIETPKEFFELYNRLKYYRDDISRFMGEMYINSEVLKKFKGYSYVAPNSFLNLIDGKLTITKFREPNTDFETYPSILAYYHANKKDVRLSAKIYDNADLSLMEGLGLDLSLLKPEGEK